MADSLGAQLVRKWLESGSTESPHTQGVLATRLSERVRRRVAQSTVSAIARGHSTPRGDLMSALKATLGIDIEAWSEPPRPKPGHGPVPPASESGVDLDDSDRDIASGE